MYDGYILPNKQRLLCVIINDVMIILLFLDDQLVLTCLDFSFPPLSALSATVTFLIQQIFKQPAIQTKIQNEIDSVVGSGRLPTLDDRIK